MQDLEAIPDSASKGEAFERVVLWFLRNDPVWASLLGSRDNPERVRLWREAHGWRWQVQDLGTDILAKDLQGRLWAFQAKCYTGGDIPKSEIDSFLADSARPQVYRRVLFHTADRLGPKASMSVLGQEKPVDVIARNALRNSGAAWPKDLDTLLKTLEVPVSWTTKSLRPYQEEAVESVSKAFEGGAERGQMLMACGSGKTLTAQRVAEACSARRILLLFPSLMLLGQTLRSWSENATTQTSFNWIAVCSDESVSQSGIDSEVVHATDVGLTNVTTDPVTIADFLRTPPDKSLQVVFATYQSSGKIAEAMTDPTLVPFEFDLMICDEAHKMAYLGRGSSSESQFALPLDNANIRACKRLFMTATRRVYGDTSSKIPDQQALIYAMDNEDVFGPVLFEYTFRRAIAEGILSDYRIFAVVVTEKDVQSQLLSGEALRLDFGADEFILSADVADLATHVALLKAMETSDDSANRVISFHRTVSRAERFARQHNAVRKALGKQSVYTAAVRGADSAFSRVAKLKALEEADRGLLSNARCLTEGVDVPNLDAILFADPKKSVIDVVQAVGRAIRKPVDSNKTIGYIIVPIFLSDEILKRLDSRQVDIDTHAIGDKETSRAFAALIEVINSLRSMDETISQTIRVSSQKAGMLSPLGMSDANPLDLLNVTLLTSSASSWETEDIPFVSNAKATELERALRLVVIDQVLTRCSEPWWVRYFELQRWLQAHEGVYPKNQGTTEKSLYRWWATQRSITSKQSLNPDRVEALEALSGWSWSERTPYPPRQQFRSWTDAYEHLLAFVEEEKRFPGYSAKAGGEERRLAGFVYQMRRQHRKADGLPKERREKLESIPGWTWATSRATWSGWDEAFDSLEKFLGEENRMPLSGHPNEKKLASWVSKQRQAYRTGALTSRRIAALESLALWAWMCDKDVLWAERYEGVQQFLMAEGRAPSSKTKNEPERTLGQWVSGQRKLYSKGRLASDRIALLDDLPGWKWKEKDRTSWYADSLERATAIKEFFDANGHLPTRTGTETEVRLHNLVGRLRSAHRKGNLDASAEAVLNSIPAWKWSSESTPRAAAQRTPRKSRPPITPSTVRAAMQTLLADGAWHEGEEVIRVGCQVALSSDKARCLIVGKRVRKGRPATEEEYAQSGARQIARNLLRIAVRDGYIERDSENNRYSVARPRKARYPIK